MRARGIKYLIPLVLLVVAIGCTSEIASITEPTLPEAPNLNGTYGGSAKWDAVQGGAPIAVTSGAGSAIIQQSNDGAILGGSTWEVTGMFTGTLSGRVDPEGNVTGIATVLVLAGLCTASTSFGGSAQGDSLTVSMSFLNPGASPCAGAPVGLTLNLSR